MSPTEAELLAANAAFYVAFSSGDVDAMDALWAKGPDVACIHPGWDALRGRLRVMASWRAILSNEGGPKITCTGATAHVLGDCAFVLCYETIEGARLVATNTFVHEEGAWRLVHHQAAPIARTVADDDDDDDDLPETGGGVLN